MKKRIITVLSILFILILTSCNYEEEIEIENPKLYPAYILESNEELWGYIDEEGKFLVEPKYNTANDFSEGLALVEKDGLFGVLDSEGKEILKIEFTNINKIENGYMTAFKDDSVMIFNYSGEELKLDREYRNIGVYSDGLFGVLIMDKEGDFKFGYIDESGNEIIKPKYSLAYPFRLSRAIVKEDEVFKVIDKKDKEFKTLEFTDIKPSSNKDYYIYSSTGDNFGLLDKDGDILIQDKYSAIVDVNEDLVVVGELDGQTESFGLLNVRGDNILETKYNDIKLLGEGYIAVSEELGLAEKNIYSILDEKLKKISEEKYYNIGGRSGKIENNIISVVSELETYAIDLEGNIVEEIPITKGYGEVYMDENIIRSHVDGERLYYNMDGQIIWEADKTYTIDSNREIVSKTYKDGDGINVNYPHFIGFAEREIQDEINKKILDQFTKDEGILEEKYNYFKTNYEITKMGNIIQVNKLEKMLMRNKIEEDTNREIYNINIDSGKFYTLEDIFKEDSNYIEKINNIISEKLLLEIDNIGIKKIAPVRRNQDFKIKDDKLYLYLRYEDSLKVLKGYEEIEMELEELKDIINFESDVFINMGEKNKYNRKS